MIGKKTWNLFGETDKSRSNDKSIIKYINVGKIKFHYNNGDFKIPNFQRELDNDKINDIKNLIKTRDDLLNFSNQVNPIQIATIQMDNKYTHLVIDGQHRLKALLMLDDSVNDVNFAFYLQLVKDQKEAISKFIGCIKGMDKNYYINEEILINEFKSKIFMNFKDLLIEKYGDYFVKSSKNKYIYKLDDFLIELRDKGFMDIIEENNVDEKYLLKMLEKCNKKFYKKVYHNYQHNKNHFYKTEQDYLDNYDYIFVLKNNNFIEYINDKSQIPNHKLRLIKKTIPKSLRLKVWDKINKDSIKCPIDWCDEIISKDNFDCGHIISEYNKGDISLENLYPICSSCNKEMNCKNWKDYDKISYQLICSLKVNEYLG
jgi:hypothetical protein